MSPLLSLLVLPGGGDDAAAALALTLDSVRAQGAGPWEAVVAEDGDDPAGRLTAAAGRAAGSYLAVLATGDQLEPGALRAVTMMAEHRGDADVLYTDEQWDGTAGIFTKPRWVPRYLEAHNYLGRLCFVRREVLERAGGYRRDFPGAEEWDVALRVTEHTDAVVHVPVVALTRAHAPDRADAVVEAGRRAVAARYERRGVPARVERIPVPVDDHGFLRVWREPAQQPLVSIVIPTAGGRREVHGREQVLVLQALRSLLDRTTYPRWEVVLAPSEHTPPEVLAQCRELCGERLRVAPVAGAFNFSRSINTGVGAARGELVLLLNDDVEVIEPRWLERMVAVAAEDGVGAVGAKLLFGDGRIQHTGIAFDAAGDPVHVHIFEDDGAGHFGTKVVDLDFLAVTAACLLMPRALFAEVGGLTEALPLNFNDVDLCLKIVAAGHRIVCTPFARLYHYESSTRQARVEDFELEALHWWLPRTMADPWVSFR